MSARLQSLPGVSTGLGSAGVRKRIGGSAGHWRLAWRQGGCWAAGRMLGGRQLCIGGRAGHLAACCLHALAGRAGQWRQERCIWRQAALHWRKSRASGCLLLACTGGRAGQWRQERCIWRQAALHWRKSRASGGLLACVVCLRGVRTGIGGADGRKSIGVRTGLLPFNAPDCAARWLKVFYSMDRIVTVSTSFERTIATLALPRWHDICKEPTKAKCCAPVVGSATIAWW